MGLNILAAGRLILPPARKGRSYVIPRNGGCSSDSSYVFKFIESFRSKLRLDDVLGFKVIDKRDFLAFDLFLEEELFSDPDTENATAIFGRCLVCAQSDPS